jgi:hypothetical protein
VSLVMASSLCSVVLISVMRLGEDVEAEIAAAFCLAHILLLRSHRQIRRRRTHLNQKATTANCG